MNSRNRRRGRQASMKARVGIAAAVLAGGGAAGVAVAASHSGVTQSVDPAGYVLHFQHRVSEQQALTSALNMWNMSRSHTQSLNMLAQMQAMRGFNTWTTGHGRHRTQMAAQRGVVVAAASNFIVVQSANSNRLELWYLNGATKQMNVTTNATGMVAMTGSNVAAHTAVTTGNTNQAAAAVASTSMVNQAAAPVVKPIVITINTGTQTITITITANTATVTPTPPASATATSTATGMATVPATPTATGMGTTTATATAMSTATATATSTAMATPPTTMATPTATMATTPATTPATTVARGDMVMVSGVRVHGHLIAQLVLFSVPATAVTPAPGTTSTAVTTAPATVGATAPGNLQPTHS